MIRNTVNKIRSVALAIATFLGFASLATSQEYIVPAPHEALPHAQEHHSTQRPSYDSLPMATVNHQLLQATNSTPANPAGIQFILTRNEDRNQYPLRILHVPYGVWIEIEGAYYQHKNLDNTIDVNVSFHLAHGTFPPTLIIKTGGSPREIRQSETSMSETVQLVPGMTVEFDYARVFGDRLEKNKSQRDRAIMKHYTEERSHSYSSSTANRLPSAPSPFDQPALPDQLSSLKIETLQNRIMLTDKGTFWSVSSETPGLLTLTASPKLISQLATEIRLKADVKTSFVNANGETVSKPFQAVILHGKLTNGRMFTSSGRSEAEVNFDFAKLFNGHSELAIYLRNSGKPKSVECSFTHVKLECLNELFGKRLTDFENAFEVSNFVLPIQIVVP